MPCGSPTPPPLVCVWRSEPDLTAPQVEMYFLTRAMAFFAGWSWITLCRDLSTLLAYHDAQTPARNYSGQFLVAFALGPMLTFLVLGSS